MARTATRRRTRETTEQACDRRIVPALAALNLRWQAGTPLADLLEEILAALEGNADAFQLLDEKPSWFGGYSGPRAYHSMLRTVRNSPLFGPQLFASFRHGGQ